MKSAIVICTFNAAESQLTNEYDLPQEIQSKLPALLQSPDGRRCFASTTGILLPDV